MASQRPRIVMVGPHPPPTHGMAAINAAILYWLRLAGVAPLVLDVSALDLSRRFIVRLIRLPKVLLAIVHLASKRGLRGAIFYISVSGGFGQIYDIFFISLARLKGMRLFMHHHSFAYLNKRKAYTQLLMNTAGSSSLHITLSDRMAEKLRSLYRAPQTVSVSNAVFCLQKNVLVTKSCKKFRKIGFISNISAQKGILEFLDLMTTIEAGNFPLHALIAGPFQDSLIEKTVCKRVSMMQNVDYLGPKFGIDKDDFFKQIDVLAFPTRYENEAEPLTVLEAMSHGIPTIAYGRGCIPEIIHAGCGRVVDTDEDFVDEAMIQIKFWLCNPTAFETASRSAVRSFSNIYFQNFQRWQELLRNLIEDPPQENICRQNDS